MEVLEKYRDHNLIAKLLAYVLFFDAGASILKMFINMIRWGSELFSIFTIIYQTVPVIAGLILLLNKHHDKIFKLSFAGSLVVTRLIMLIRIIASGNPPVTSVLSNFVQFILTVAIAAYYLGVIRPAGRKNHLIVVYGIMGIAAIFWIFPIGSISVGIFGLCAVMVLYGYQETRGQGNQAMFVYGGMIGTAYYMLYIVISGLLGLFYVYLPGFFGYTNFVLVMAMPLLVYDRIVPNEGQSLMLDFGALTGASAPAQYAQPMQQNNFDPMTGQPINVQPQQNNFDPMTGQPINVQPQQNNFDPMTGQPINVQPQQNKFDPMTGKPIDPNGGQ